MNWRNQTTERFACLALIAGLAVGCFGVSQASAGFSFPAGGPIEDGTTIEDPTDLKNPQPDEIDIWEDSEPEIEVNPIAHIDIPEIDKDGKPKAPAPTPLLLPPLPDPDSGDSIFGDRIPDLDIEWMRSLQESAPLLEGHTLSDGSIVLGSQTISGVPAPGGLGVLGLGVLALSRRRRA